MSTTTPKYQQIAASFSDKAYRDAFVEENIKNHLAYQIQAMRAARGWTQADLGQESGKSQEQISRLEDPDYGRFTITTLLKLASAFDVALIVKFAPFSELVEAAAELSMDDLAVSSYAEDLGAIAETNTTTAAEMATESALGRVVRQWSTAVTSQSVGTASTPYQPILQPAH